MTLPSFDSKLTRVTVTFPKHTLLTPEVLRWIEGLHEPGLSEAQVSALALMREGRPVSNGTHRQLGLDSWVATLPLSDLVGRGLAYRVGSRRYAEYLLSEDRVEVADDDLFSSFGTTPTPRQAPVRKRLDRTEQIEALFESHDELTSSQVMELTGLGYPMVTKYLQRLVPAGSISPTAAAGSRHRSYRRTISQRG